MLRALRAAATPPELVPKRKLYNTRICGSRDTVISSTFKRSIDAIKIRVVEDIEELGPESDDIPFRDVKALVECHLKIDKSRAND